MSDLLFPVRGATRISSTFGGRSSPGGIGSTNHKGIDIAAPMGSPVVAPTNLTILSAGRAGGYGNMITGQDASGNTYQFAHLSGMGVKPGQQIQAGSVIGAVGSTGASTGSHLHFGIKDKDGKFIDPAKAGLDIGKKALQVATKGVVSLLPEKAANAVGRVASKTLDTVIPGAGTLASAVGIIPGGGEKSLLEQFRDWLKESGFFQRIALAFFAFILLMGAVYMMKATDIGSLVKGT